jgi:hypothetical protein
MLHDNSGGTNREIPDSAIPAHFARRWTRNRPELLPVESIDEPHRIVSTSTGYEVAGIARVDIAPGRNRGEARRLADRIARCPLTYLPLCLWFGLPGVADLRVTFGKVVAHV